MINPVPYRLYKEAHLLGTSGKPREVLDGEEDRGEVVDELQGESHFQCGAFPGGHSHSEETLAMMMVETVLFCLPPFFLSTMSNSGFVLKWRLGAQISLTGAEKQIDRQRKDLFFPPVCTWCSSR